MADGRRTETARHFLTVAGAEIPFAPGAVSIARSAGVALLPTFVVDEPGRTGPASLRLVIHPPLELQVSDNARADAQENLRRFASVYDKQIRAYPHNFLWDRWIHLTALDPIYRRLRGASHSLSPGAYRRPGRQFRHGREGSSTAAGLPSSPDKRGMGLESQTSEIETTLREHVRSTYAGGESGLALEPQDDLLERGVVDSMAVFELASFIQEEFGVTVAQEDIVPDNFTSLATMTRYVALKKGVEGENPLLASMRLLVAEAVPDDAVVLVVSHGDDALLALDGRTAWHFPRDEQGVHGYKPADGSEAIRHLEKLRAQGATHIVFPQPQLWWLEEYAGLRDYLESDAGQLGRSEAGVVYSLPRG